MCPMYTWKSECCGEEVSVVRHVVDIEVPPNPAADPPECKCQCAAPRWVRLMCASTFKFACGGFHSTDYHKYGPRR